MDCLLVKKSVCLCRNSGVGKVEMDCRYVKLGGGQYRNSG
jgi:hypothetical protein